MKKILVEVHYEMEIPEGWNLTPNGTYLCINGKFFEPDITWLEYLEEAECMVEISAELQEKIDRTIKITNKKLSENA